MLCSLWMLVALNQLSITSPGACDGFMALETSNLFKNLKRLRTLSWLFQKGVLKIQSKMVFVPPVCFLFRKTLCRRIPECSKWQTLWTQKKCMRRSLAQMPTFVCQIATNCCSQQQQQWPRKWNQQVTALKNSFLICMLQW